MPSALPDGEPVPPTGELPGEAVRALGQRPFGLYLHVPFCRSRCGYCDFNTYTGLDGLRRSYAETAAGEIRLARRVLGGDAPAVSTVFVGGGTPTLLPAGELAGLLATVRDEFGLAPGAEVTTEANPDSVDAAGLERLLAAGFTRVSFGMQSAVPHVLGTLERSHTPGRAVAAAREAARAGFPQVSVDLIYGTPGESDEDWRASLEAALAAQPTHVSAYALIVEPGTRLASRVARGELAPPDDDVLADRYLMADEALSGLGWYEVSNWGEPCRHNLGYWRGDDWWGVGPGAHSHVGGVRWWNVRHPDAYAQRLAAGLSPAQARERLTAEQRRVERVLLELRLRDGLPLSVLHPAGRAAAQRYADRALLELPAGRAVLTREGRLLADAVVRDLVE